MDALSTFRTAVVSKTLPIPSTTSDVSSEPQPAELAEARYLYFANPSPHSLSLDTITRFVRGEIAGKELAGTPINLRSVYLAYIYNELSPTIYFRKVEDLNGELPPEQHAQGLQFVEKLELMTWLEGADGSDLVKPLETSSDAAAATADAVASTVPVISGTGAGVTQTSINGRPVKVIDARLQAIYNGERKMGDRNTVLRGIKPTVSYPTRFPPGFTD